MHRIWAKKLAPALVLAALFLLLAGARPAGEPYGRITYGIGIIELRELGGEIWERLRSAGDT